MNKVLKKYCGFFIIGRLLLVILFVGPLAAQSQPSRQAGNASTAKGNSSTMSEEDISATRQQLFQLLRVSPKLTTVVVRDPSLLSDQAYVGRNNPELAQFIEAHPEIARNPEFYLFANLGRGGNREMQLEREIWPDVPRERTSMDRFDIRDVWALLVFICILSTLVWVFRVLQENRRWTRTFNVQTEIYNKLLDKFSTNEELLAYVRTESGKHFLESAAIPFGLDLQQRQKSPIARVLTPLQLGVVLFLVGLGFLYLRMSINEPSLLIVGILTLMLGLGFIISAGLSWILARRLGLLPDLSGAQPENGRGLDASERM